MGAVELVGGCDKTVQAQDGCDFDFLKG